MTPKLGFSKEINQKEIEKSFCQDMGKFMDEILGDKDGASKEEFLELTNGKLIKVQKIKLSSTTMYIINYNNNPLITFYSNTTNKISYNNAIELLGGQEKTTKMILSAIELHKKENNKANKIKGKVKKDIKENLDLSSGIKKNPKNNFEKIGGPKNKGLDNKMGNNTYLES